MNERESTQLHTGHRIRLKQKARKFGVENLSPHEIIEYILFFGIPYKDTNELAHMLIDKYRTVAGVLGASYSELIEFPNMTADAAQLITSLPNLLKCYLTAKHEDAPVVLSTNLKTEQYLARKFLDKCKEAVYILYLDNRKKLINEICIDANVPDRIELSPRIVLENALNFKATSVTIAHNHPAGDCTPSGADIEFTEALAALLNDVGIDFNDHLVFGANEFFSFKLTKLIKKGNIDD